MKRLSLIVLLLIAIKAAVQLNLAAVLVILLVKKKLPLVGLNILYTDLKINLALNSIMKIKK